MNKFIPVNEPLFIGNEKKYLTDCIKSGWVSSEGKYVKKFENKFAKKVSRKFGTTVSSGSAALEIAINALELKKNDEVILPTFTIASCLFPILRTKAKPIFVDCDLRTWNCQASEIIKKISKKTKAIILVHIYGLTIDIDKILKIAKKKKIYIIEDAAEVHGLKYKKKMCGSFGDMSTFSFYSNKNITTGEGGMILTNNSKIFKEINKLKNLYFGNGSQRFMHKKLGWNFRMSNLQAAVGLAQLEKLDFNIKKRREIGKYYNLGLKKFENIFYLPVDDIKYCKNIYWIYGLVIKKEYKITAKKFMNLLNKKGVGTRPFFFPLHKQPIIKKLNKQNLPNSEFISKNGFYIPSGLGIKLKQQKYVVDKIEEVINENF